MKIAVIFANISSFIWLLPPLRQFRGAYFIFFLLYALMDAVIYVSFEFLNIRFYPQYFYVIASILVFFSILYQQVKFKFYVPVIALVIISVVLCLIESLKHYLDLTMTVISFLIIYLLAKGIIISISEKKLFNLFTLIVLMFEISTAIKWYQFAMRTRTGFVFFYITSFFEILLAIFFTIFRPDSPSMIIKFRDKGPSNL